MSDFCRWNEIITIIIFSFLNFVKWSQWSRRVVQNFSLCAQFKALRSQQLIYMHRSWQTCAHASSLTAILFLCVNENNSNKLGETWDLKILFKLSAIDTSGPLKSKLWTHGTTRYTRKAVYKPNHQAAKCGLIWCFKRINWLQEQKGGGGGGPCQRCTTFFQVFTCCRAAAVGERKMFDAKQVRLFDWMRSTLCFFLFSFWGGGNVDTGGGVQA